MVSLPDEPLVCGEECGEDPLVDVRLIGSFECILGGAGSPVGVVWAARCRFRGEPAAPLDGGEIVDWEEGRRRLRGRSEDSLGLDASVVGWLEEGCAVDTGAGEVVGDEAAIGRSVAIGGVVVLLLSSAEAGGWVLEVAKSSVLY